MTQDWWIEVGSVIGHHHQRPLHRNVAEADG